MALTAAETGHLVFGTLHTSGAPNTVNRIIDVFPPEQQGQIRAQLAESLNMVVTQKLFKKKDGSGRVGAFEVMVCNAPIKNLIREAKIHQIPSVMQTGQREGMITMEKSIEELIGTGVISMPKKTVKGFTLIELLVVVAIIGILSAIGVVAYGKYTTSAKMSNKKTTSNVVDFIKSSYGIVL